MKAKNAAFVCQEIANSGKLAPGYLVFGEEMYWHRRILSSIASMFPEGGDSLTGDEITWEAIRDLLAQPSFFGPSAFFVRGAEKMFPDSGGRYIDRLSDGNCLALLCETAKNPAPREFLERWASMGGVMVEASEPSFAQATAWAKQAFEQDGFRITKDALDSLVTATGRSIERLEQEIQKIKSYIGSPSGGPKPTVTPQVVVLCASSDPEKTAFGLLDAVSTKNGAKAFSEYLEIRARGANPVAVISLLASHFSLIWRVKEAEAKGVSPSAIPKALGVHPYPAKKASWQAKRWTFGQLENAFYALCTADEGIKTGRMDPDRVMDYLLSRLCHT